MPQVLGYVVCASDGTVLHASGVNKVEHISAGLYHIIFNFSVANACAVASIATATGRAISANIPPKGSVNSVEVNTQYIDEAFQLLVVA